LTTIQDITSPMSAPERRATLSLASIYALRMLGLFLIMPVISLFSEQLAGSTPALIGWAIGAYGLTQAIFQIPFGLLSDRLGRKKIIVIGLLLFAAGSIIAALSSSIYGVLLGRAIQGSGAIAGPIMALLADLTQEVHRTKAMALIGASIGLSFGVAVTGGPALAAIIGMHGLFWLITGFSLLAIVMIVYLVPNPQQVKKHRDTELIPANLSQVIQNLELMRLDYGIFSLHLILSASFVIVPLLMRDAGLFPAEHWKVYLPVFIGSMAAIIPFVILAETKQQMKGVFLGAIVVLITSNLGLMFWHDSLLGIIVFLGLFFCAFNLLEATLPSLVSKTAPADLRGTAMGIYSTTQFLGAGLGGALGGWCYGNFGAGAVFLLCAAAALSWLLVSFNMKAPRYWSNLLISLESFTDQAVDELANEMLKINGIEEVTLHLEEAVAYLKVDRQKLDAQRLQSLIRQATAAG